MGWWLTRRYGAAGRGGVVAAAEKWRGEEVQEHVGAGSNVLRERAHGFYLRYGYEHYKTQKASEGVVSRRRAPGEPLGI
jgi:hypothetical protein